MPVAKQCIEELNQMVKIKNLGASPKVCPDISGEKYF